MKYKGRKKYTEADTKGQIESINMSIGNYSEEIMYASTQGIDPLILALCHKTNEECIEDSEKQIEYLFSKKEYLKQFLCNT